MTGASPKGGGRLLSPRCQLGTAETIRVQSLDLVPEGR